MGAVKAGGDRQQMHEIIRRHSMDATARMKEGLPAHLLEELGADPEFVLSADEIASVLDPKDYIGRCPEQVSLFLEKLPLSEPSAAVEEITL